MSATLLHVDRLVKRFGGLTATDHASVRVLRGEVHALIDPTGRQTTLVHQISGALAPDADRALRCVDVTRMPMHERVLRGLGALLPDHQHLSRG